MTHSAKNLYHDHEAEMAFDRHVSRMKDNEIDFIPLFATPDTGKSAFYKTMLPVSQNIPQRTRKSGVSFLNPLFRMLQWSR